MLLRPLFFGREWNTKFSIIPEIPSKRVHSKRIPKFSKTFPEIFTVPFGFRPEISEVLVEWKAPRECLRDHPSQRLMIKCLTRIQIELEFRNVGF